MLNVCDRLSNIVLSARAVPKFYLLFFPEFPKKFAHYSHQILLTIIIIACR